MSVRAKFKVTKIESQSYVACVGKSADGRADRHEKVEMRTIVMHPVYSSDPNSENKKFWDASPSGELKLGTINPAAWAQFELDGEYYLDFTRVE